MTHSPRQYLFFYLVFVLATAIISTAMDGGIGVEERHPGVEEEDSKSEKAYQTELLKKISEETFLVKLLDDRTDVNMKQNMMRDVNAVDDKTIRSVLKDFECPNEPTIIKGRGTPDCDGTKVCSIAKASLRDMKITKEECEKLKSALMKPDPARFRRVPLSPSSIPSAQSFRFPVAAVHQVVDFFFPFITRPVITMLNMALSRHERQEQDERRRREDEFREEDERRSDDDKRRNNDNFDNVFDTSLVSVFLLDYDGCSDAVSPFKRKWLQGEFANHPGVRKVRREFFLNMEALRGSRVISFCASARQGSHMDWFNANSNDNGYALGSAKTYHHPSAFEAMSARYEWTLNKATMSDFPDNTIFDHCVDNWRDEQCHVDGNKWDHPYVQNKKDWYSEKLAWGNQDLNFNYRIKVSTAENALRALGRMSPDVGGLTDEEKASGVNVIFFDDYEKYLRAVRRHANIPEDLGFRVNFFTLEFDPDKVSRGNKATKLRKFGDEYTTYDFAHLHTDAAVRRRADENMGKQVEGTELKRTRGQGDLQAFLRDNSN